MRQKDEGTSGRRNAKNGNLIRARKAKNDEFYTQYEDIEAEMNAYIEYNPNVFRNKTILLPCDDHEWSNFTKYFRDNFERLGLGRLVSTAYSREGRGKLFVKTECGESSGLLEGDGDFRSEEVTRLRDEADIIITNPPFSLFRKFIAWVMEGKKQFVVMGNLNAITYKEVFPLLKENKMWLGCSVYSGNMKFNVPDEYPLNATECGFDPDGRKFIRVTGIRWFTNIEHGKRNEFLQLDTMKHNLKYNKKLQKKLLDSFGTVEYPHYDNYDAIEVPLTMCIPSDYDGVMGVPISFLDKYCPEQFEIVGMCENDDLYGMRTRRYTSQECKERYFEIFGKPGVYTLNASGVVQGKKVYQRILIRSVKRS